MLDDVNKISPEAVDKIKKRFDEDTLKKIDTYLSHLLERRPPVLMGLMGLCEFKGKKKDLEDLVRFAEIVNSLGTICPDVIKKKILFSFPFWGSDNF